MAQEGMQILRQLFLHFMHLADAFIQSDLHCIQVTVSTIILFDI